MEMAAKEMRNLRKNKMRLSRENKIRRAKDMNDHAAAYYPVEMTSKEIRALRKNKLRMSRQNNMKIPRQKKITRVKEMTHIDDAAAQPHLPEEMNIDADAPPAPTPYLPEEMNIDAAAAPTPVPYLPEEMNIDAAAASPYLAEELVIENILTRLPFRTLSQYSCISKLWCNSISNDAHFAKTHFAHNKNQVRKYGSGRNYVSIINPIRREILSLPYQYPNDGGECQYLCHGFGFDSSTDEYKLVIIFTSKDIEEYFISMVFTLGTRSWRKSVTSVAQISPPPGCSPFPSRLVTRRAATLCGGDLFWKITAKGAVEEEATVVTHNHTEEVRDNNNRIGMLLSFNIHKEKIQFVQLPAECNVTAPMPTTMNVVVEHHLLEHKGYPCVAQSEKAMACCCPDGQSSFCCGCCCFTVQLYLLQDKEKQVWIKGETFSVQVKDLGLLPAPFCCYFDTATTAAATTARYPTRILSVSDQVLLHWFDGKCLKIYNLQTKHLDVVGSSSCSDELSGLLFDCKTCGFPPFNGIGNHGYSYHLYADCQLHVQAESILSLKTFIPAGETRRYYDTKVPKSQKNNPPAGWLSTERESVKYRVFF
ncbi:uncharacterized protein LOC113358701 isoform X2 [Papaver somniferum]|uniref:uncharacterized protein LOC113358701 isoform X2 n=1 Tax=Papaver somniferum TaxID=3469 RepID=UPI000E6FA35D|nr:uncharacterized protein LOC113358701 isoform X2 [Papaver somniferum]